jgi:hypothetical protein
MVVAFEYNLGILGRIRKGDGGVHLYLYMQHHHWLWRILRALPAHLN